MNQDRIKTKQITKNKQKTKNTEQTQSLINSILIVITQLTISHLNYVSKRKTPATHQPSAASK